MLCVTMGVFRGRFCGFSPPKCCKSLKCIKYAQTQWEHPKSKTALKFISNSLFITELKCFTYNKCCEHLFISLFIKPISIYSHPRSMFIDVCIEHDQGHRGADEGRLGSIPDPVCLRLRQRSAVVSHLRFRL